MSFITASTSVVLVPTATSNAPFFIYLNNVSTAGRIVTVRDNDGYASLTNQIVIAPRNGAYFTDGTSSISINQPYGYVTLNTAVNGGYGVLNTFGFPAGSAAAFVSNVTSCNFTTSTIGAQYISAPTGVFNLINTNTISVTTILVNTFTPNSMEANTISTGAITGGSLSFQTIFGSTITTNNLSFPSLTVANANFTNITVSNTTTTSNVAFVGDVIVYGTTARTSIGTSNTIATTGIVIGSNAGGGVNSVAIGVHANSSGTGVNATSVGFGAGRFTQGNNTVAIGNLAGNSNQGANAIAIGAAAGQTNQSTNTIVLNATDSALNTSTSSAFYIAPIRADSNISTARSLVYYNTATKEITADPNNLSIPSTFTTFLSTNRIIASSIGIGTTSPTTTLDVVGSTRILANGSTSATLYGTIYDSLVIQTTGTTYSTTPASILFNTSQPSYPIARIVGIPVGVSPGAFRGDLVFQTQNNTQLNEQMRITYAGFVGIGTSNPTSILHVRGEPTNEPYSQIFIEGTGGAPNGAFGLSNTSGWGRLGVSGATNNYLFGSLVGDICLESKTTNKKLLFGNNGVAGMCLSNNRLGIATNSPAYTLDVNGQVWARSTLYVGSSGTQNVIRFYGTNGDVPGGFTRTVISERLYGGTEQSELVLFKGDDHVSPSGPDRVRVLASGGFQVDCGSISGPWNEGADPPTAAYSNALNVSGTNGYVGIGTGSPAYTLDVNGDANVRNNFWVGTTTGTSKMVGANGKMYIQAGSNQTNGSGIPVVFTTINDTLETMRIDTTLQRVGIKTTTPSFPLDVAGTIRGSGNIVRTISRRLGTGAGSVSFTPGSNTVLSLSYTPVQSGNVSTLVICSPSYNFLSGSGFDRFLLYMICPNSADNDSLYMGQNNNVIEGSRGFAPIIHSFQILAGQNGTGTYRLAIDSGGGLSDDSVFFNNQTTITIMELSQT